jgi:2-oxoglutarate dehydrogenase E1 component
LLRHPKVVSTIEDLTTGSFQKVIDDAEANPKKVKSLVFCTGKFYYELQEEKEKRNREDIALVRIEQLFPLPAEEIRSLIKKYGAEDVVWAQEEPQNMGAWGFLLLHLDEAKTFRLCSQPFYGAPAAGSAERFRQRHGRVLNEVFETKNKS